MKQIGPQESQRPQLLAAIHQDHSHGGYVSYMFPAFNGTGVWVGPNTLRPDCSFSSKHLTAFLLSRTGLIQGLDCIDVGCGSGVQTLALALSGAKSVEAVDISTSAVESTYRNKSRHRLNNILAIHHSDLFSFNDFRSYDVVVFNHPFFHMSPDLTDPISTAIMDNGSTLERFFRELMNHLRPGGKLVMPFSFICGPENDPRPLAEKYGLRPLESIQILDNNGRHVIYLFNL